MGQAWTFYSGKTDLKNELSLKKSKIDTELIELRAKHNLMDYKNRAQSLIEAINNVAGWIRKDLDGTQLNIREKVSKPGVTLGEAIDIKLGYASVVRILKKVGINSIDIQGIKSNVTLSRHPLPTHFRLPELPEKPSDLLEGDFRNEYCRIIRSTLVDGSPILLMQEGAEGLNKMIPGRYRDDREIAKIFKILESEPSSNMLRALTLSELKIVRDYLVLAPEGPKSLSDLGRLLQPAGGIGKEERSLLIEITKVFKARERIAELSNTAPEIFCTHATNIDNAMNIIKSGRQHSEVEAKKLIKKNTSQDVDIANSPMGNLIEEEAISFSINGLEGQYLMKNGKPHPQSETQGVVFVYPFSEIGSQKSWFQRKNTQRSSGPQWEELAVIDDGTGLDIRESMVLCRAIDFDYWRNFLLENGYKEDWVNARLQTFESTDEALSKSKEFVASISVDKPKRPIYNGMHGHISPKIIPTPSDIAHRHGVKFSEDTEVLKAVPLFTLA
jgi:hypothetical protein